LTLNKHLTLTGLSGSASTTLTGTTTATVSAGFTVSITGFTLDPTTRGIDVGVGSTVNLSDVAISGISVTSSGTGIRLASGTTLTIDDCAFSDNDIGSGNGGHIYAPSGGTIT